MRNKTKVESPATKMGWERQSTHGRKFRPRQHKKGGVLPRPEHLGAPSTIIRNHSTQLTVCPYIIIADNIPKNSHNPTTEEKAGSQPSIQKHKTHILHTTLPKNGYPQLASKVSVTTPGPVYIYIYIHICTYLGNKTNGQKENPYPT